MFDMTTGAAEMIKTNQDGKRTMSFKMNDLPLLLKVSIAPAFAFLVLLAVAFYANFGLGQSATGVSAIVETDMRLSRQLQDANNQFKQLDGDLYRLMTFYAADSETIDLETGVEGLKRQIEGINQVLAAIKSDFGGEINVAELESVEAELVKYGEAIDVVTSMLEIDFASAVSFLEPFKDNAAIVSGVFDGLSQKAQQTSDTRAAVIQDDVEGIKTTFLIGTIVAGFLVAVLSWLIGQMTSKSIRQIAGATEKLAGGDRTVDIASLARRDELGTVVMALDQFRAQMIENDRLQAEQREMREKSDAEERRRADDARGMEERQRTEDENRRTEAEAERKRTMHELASSFDKSVNSVMAVVQGSAEQLDGSATGVQERAGSNSELCQNLSAVAEDVSSGMQTVATATEELSSSIGEIARQMEQSSREISETVEQTNETNKTAQELATSAEKIGEVVNLINEIAAQTNLLALNATIEAARAGDAGKGFAVVASEVKGLAAQTAKATEDIASHVDNVQSVTRKVVTAMENIGGRIETINEIATAVAAAVEEQTSATSEIARTVSSANDKVTTLAQNSDELTGSANENGQAAGELLAIVSTLKTEFSQLERETSGFVDNIRSA